MPDKPYRLHTRSREDRPQQRPLYPHEQQKLGQMSLLPSVWYLQDRPNMPDNVFIERSPQPPEDIVA